MYSAPRTMVSGRIPEYLDNLKAEYESLAHDANMYKMQRDDYERKSATNVCLSLVGAHVRLMRSATTTRGTL